MNKPISKMTKAELLVYVKNIQEELDEARTDLAVAYSDNDDLQEQIDDLENNEEGPVGIINVDNFIFKLKIENLHSDKLESFINEYITYHNNPI